MSDIVDDLRAFNEERLNIEPWTCEQIAKAAADMIDHLRAQLAAAKREGWIMGREAAVHGAEVIAYNDGWQQCCGNGRNCGDHDECCGEPDLIVKIDKVAYAIRALPIPEFDGDAS